MDNTFIHAFFWFFTNEVIILHSVTLLISVFFLVGSLYLVKEFLF